MIFLKRDYANPASVFPVTLISLDIFMLTIYQKLARPNETAAHEQELSCRFITIGFFKYTRNPLLLQIVFLTAVEKPYNKR